MVKLGIIGCGHWGKNLARNYSLTDDCLVKTIAENSIDRQNHLKEIFEDVEIISDYNHILNDPSIDAVVIATPPVSHFTFTQKALNAGKHVFVEKPLALNVKDAKELVEHAHHLNKILMVGHTVLYNESVKIMRDIIKSGEIGEVYYIYASRLNLGIVRPDVNVMWSLAPHDISVLLYILEKKPLKVSAKGLSYIQNNIEDVVYLNITFENNINAQIHLSWLDPNKKREITIVGSKKMLVYDDLSAERIKIFDKGIERNDGNIYLGEYNSFAEYNFIHRAGDVMIPKVNINEPLKQECRHFIECIKDNVEPLTSGRSAISVIQILESADLSLRDAGMEVPIDL
jgi:predicted dehydrogenase